MGWGDFVENNVRAELIRLGFSVAVAQGGGIRSAEALQPPVESQSEGENLR